MYFSSFCCVYQNDMNAIYNRDFCACYLQRKIYMVKISNCPFVQEVYFLLLRISDWFLLSMLMKQTINIITFFDCRAVLSPSILAIQDSLH